MLQARSSSDKLMKVVRGKTQVLTKLLFWLFKSLRV